MRPDEWERAGTRLSHAAIALVVLVSFVTQVVLTVTGGADANSGRVDAHIGVGERLVRLFSYFTVDSNLIVLGVAICLVLNPARNGVIWRVVWLDALLGIVITGLVFDIVLAPIVRLTGAALWVTIGFHYVSPWLTLAAWLLFGPRQRIDWRTIGYAFIWPLAWIIYTFVHGAISGWYPYPFLDVGIHGYPVALRNTALVVLVAGVLALIFKALDARLPTVAGPSLGRRDPLRPLHQVAEPHPDEVH
ncbi:Pr6Pr family membrane protein [Actinophytocola sp.]|uniref:Pr6Pr family membrane protein n=1 Tax=Actinophytocola sp. TaxID=1872138 RepID=UPI0039C894A5